MHPRIRFSECRACKYDRVVTLTCLDCEDADRFTEPAPEPPAPPAPAYGVNTDPSFDDVIALVRAARKAIGSMPHDAARAALAYALENVDQWLDNENVNPRV
jgi:hypothetical protein